MSACKHPWATHPATGQELSIDIWMKFNFWGSKSQNPKTRRTKIWGFFICASLPFWYCVWGSVGSQDGYAGPKMGSKQWYLKCSISIWKIMINHMQPSNSGVYKLFSDPNIYISNGFSFRQTVWTPPLSQHFQACDIGTRRKLLLPATHRESKGLEIPACGMQIWLCPG